MRRFVHRLSVEANTPGNEAFGEPAESWEEVWKVWGDIRPMQGNEYVQAQQAQSSVSHKITTRYFPGANSQMRLVHGERVYNVESVVNVDERNRFLEWMCREVT